MVWRIIPSDDIKTVQRRDRLRTVGSFYAEIRVMTGNDA